MPIELKHPLRRISQEEFGSIAFEVTGIAFALHSKLGRLFDEKSYQRALKRRLGTRAETEFRIRVSHGSFETHYSVDLVVDDGAIFELKTVEHLTDRHYSQLLNYLMLTDTGHGKLLNFRPPSVEQEFANTSLTGDERRAFSVDDSEWDRRPEGTRRFEELVLELVSDWGTGLVLNLYEDGLTHFLGGEERVHSRVEVVVDGLSCGEEKVKMLSPGVGFWVTCLRDDDYTAFESHLCRFLEHTRLSHIQWANITVGSLMLKTLAGN